MVAEVRTQIGKGADLIKIYADYSWGKNREVLPTFSVSEIEAAVAVAKSGGRQVVAHASSPEGMRRAIIGGVSVIEHGDNGTEEIFALMKKNNVSLCPTISAGEAVAMYNAASRGIPLDSTRFRVKRKSFQAALRAGVTICMGGDAGVFSHGDNAREMLAMEKYGMSAIEVLRSSTSINADVFGYGEKLGNIKPGFLADLIAVQGDPSKDPSSIKRVVFVMKDGKIFKDNRKPGN